MRFLIMFGWKKDGDLLDEEELEQEFQATEFKYGTKNIDGKKVNVIEVYNKTLGYYSSYSTDTYIPLTAFNPEALNV